MATCPIGYNESEFINYFSDSHIPYESFYYASVSDASCSVTSLSDVSFLLGLAGLLTGFLVSYIFYK